MPQLIIPFNQTIDLAASVDLVYDIPITEPSQYLQGLCWLTSTYIGQQLAAEGETFFLRHQTYLKVDGHSAGLVFRAELVSQGTGIKCDVVCKIGWTRGHVRRLDNEQRTYQRLSDLQGECIPHLLGMFRGDTAEGDTSCLITSFAGKPLQRPLEEYHMEFREFFIKSLCKIHECGIRYTESRGGPDSDYWPWLTDAVVESEDNRPIIINLSRAEDHTCAAKKETLVMYKLESTGIPISVPCKEIRNACWAVGFWTFRNICDGEIVPIPWVLEGETLLEKRLQEELQLEPHSTQSMVAQMSMDCESWMCRRSLWDGKVYQPIFSEALTPEAAKGLKVLQEKYNAVIVSGCYNEY